MKISKILSSSHSRDKMSTIFLRLFIIRRKYRKYSKFYSSREKIDNFTKFPHNQAKISKISLVPLIIRRKYQKFYKSPHDSEKKKIKNFSVLRKFFQAPLYSQKILKVSIYTMSILRGLKEKRFQRKENQHQKNFWKEEVRRFSEKD